MSWHWPHLRYVRRHLARVTSGEIKKLAISWAPQHAKTESVTVRYPLWRMLREPGLRAGVASYNQRFTNKQSRKTRKLVRRLGLPIGEPNMVDEWALGNGSTFIGRGVGAGISGEPLDLMVIDDPFKNRKEAESELIQENVYEWYMDDVTPRVQRDGAVILIHTRFNTGDLIGRIRRSEEASEWVYINLAAIAGENDPIGRAPGEPLCPDRFPLERLESKRLTMGVGFESEYQGLEISRGGSFFLREWFDVVDRLPDRIIAGLRYWDLGGKKKETSCWTAGVRLATDGRYVYVTDVVRKRLAAAERNDMIRDTTRGDVLSPWFRGAYFEEQPALGIEVGDQLIRTCLGLPMEGDVVRGDKRIRAEPVADAARRGLVKLVAGPWNAAFLSEIEGFPNGPWKDQVDSLSGGFNRLAKVPTGDVPGSVEYPDYTPDMVYGGGAGFGATGLPFGMG